MKQSFVLLFLWLSVQVCAQSVFPSIIPQPVSLNYNEGYFELNDSKTIGFSGVDDATVTFLYQQLTNQTGFSFPKESANVANIQLEKNPHPDTLLGNEGYKLIITPDKISLKANAVAGLWYGIQTLQQMLPVEKKSGESLKIASAEIVDYPRFEWRGMMLDVSRHFFTKEEVKAFIDQIARCKFNVFHWHLTDDNGWRIEIKTLPQLTEVGAWRVERYGQFGRHALPQPGEPATYGGFYTHDDIREIVRYAWERNITIVPEIDIPGHSMAALAAYPELSCTKDTSIKVNPGTPFSEWFADGSFKMSIDNTLNPSDEKVYNFLDKVFTEVADLFPGEYIHVGGDECYRGFWENDSGCMQLMNEKNMADVGELQVYFMNRVAAILKLKGKKMIGWDQEGDFVPGSAIMCWRGFMRGIEAARQGHPVVMTPTQYCYLDYQQGEATIEPPVYASLRLKTCYGFEPVPDGVDEKSILGGQGNLWTENIPTFRAVEYMIYPRAWALSEVLWSPRGQRNWDNFIGKVESHFEQADLTNMNYSKAIYDPIITTYVSNDKLMLAMESEAPDVDIYYTIDCTMPDSFSRKYTEPVELPDGPITLRVIAFSKGKPVGHLITLSREELMTRTRSPITE